MKACDARTGAIVRIPGVDLELEVLLVSSSSVYVRPTRRERRHFTTSHGEPVEIRTRPLPFRIARETIVEEAR